jgi:ABC-type nitrate/sulfonate/bicarbonate transport system ATPase subunit
VQIDIVDLEFSYPGADGAVNRVVSGFDLGITSGSFHAIVGPSGCGKTTILRLIAGLERPQRGRIDMTGSPRRTHPTAMVFESPRLLPWWNVERNVGIGLEFSNRPRDLIERVREFYTVHVGLGGLGKRRPDQLSMGQASRAGLGRAVAHEADVLLLDEPLAHLDAIARRNIQRDLEQLWMADGRTTVLVTHDVEEAVLLSDRVTVIRSGDDPIVDTIEVDAPRPRAGLDQADPGLRAATVKVWEALERAST